MPLNSGVRGSTVTTVVALALDDHLRVAEARRLVDGDPSEPYLSLAVFDAAQSSEIARCCASLAVELAPITIEISGLGTFQGESPVIFAAVTLTEELRLLHASVHKAFPEFPSRPYYEPGAWVPHITLGVCETNSAAESMSSRLLPCTLRGKYTSSALLQVSVPPVSIEQRYELSGHT